MKILWIALGLLGFAHGASVDDFTAAAKAKHGEAGGKAAEFLVGHMPERDKRGLTAEFLTENLDLAFQARATFPWAGQVPEKLFWNDVLPYAVLDETREPWRKDFLKLAADLVWDAKTASEAAQALNREFFNRIKVHYDTGRKRPNQSPAESIESGKATCTGLSIILVNACRAVGIPARAVGTPLWSNKRGNHTWVEIWDGEWKFTGADEYDAEGLNCGWFTADAARAKADEPAHAIYATSWEKTGLAFPLVWAPGKREVAAVNVTGRYAKETTGGPSVGVRLWDRKGGQRIIADVRLLDANGNLIGEGQTRSGTADLNDMVSFRFEPGFTGLLCFHVGDETRKLPVQQTAAGESTLDVAWNDLAKTSPDLAVVEAWMLQPVAKRNPDAPALKAALSKTEAAEVLKLLSQERLSTIASERKREMDEMAIVLGDKTLRWQERTFGEVPEGGRSLWISMHGGGGAPAAVNDQQWQNQILLYQPSEGIYVAPRAPTDNWNLWHESHIDPMFQRLIENHVAMRGVNPDRVYLMGYSAGGDGVWQLAPRMADRFAAAAMMAGHPNEASLLGLRNLPFAIFMGANDGAYDRNKVAAERSAELARLHEADPAGYTHLSRIYEGLGHWMERKDSEALPWMAKFSRNPWPDKIVWLQDDVLHERFYWLRIPDQSTAKAGDRITATVEGQTIRVDGDVPPKTELRLSDRLLDLDQPVTVIVNGGGPITATVSRNAGSILQCLAERADPPAAGTAVWVLP